MAAWENSREAERNEKSFGLLPFHHGGMGWTEIWVGPSIGMSPLGAGLSSFDVTCLASLHLGDTGHEEAQVIPEPGLQEEGRTSQGMWMKSVVEGRAASWLGDLHKHGLGGHRGYNSPPFVQSLTSPKSATADAPVETWAELDGPHTSGCPLLLKSPSVPNY